MAVREYIGARYVIKIYENSQDPSSAEWEANTYYEPLVMVTFNNSSYVSKKAVPNTIGNPALNPSYWCVTGYYNGQISHLQDEIDEINNIKLYDNKHRGFIFQGDSFDTLHSPGWSYHVIDNIGCDYSVVKSGGGYGFKPASTSPNYGKNWIDLLIADTSINDEDITDICVCGGSNDRSQNDSELKTAMAEYDTYVRQRFPNLKNIYLGFIGFDYTNTFTTNNINASVIRYRNNALNLGWTFLEGVQYICRNPHHMMSNNLNHPTAATMPILGDYISQAIRTGSCDYCVSDTTAFTENTDIITSGTGVYNVVFEIRNGFLKVYPSGKTFTTAADISGRANNIFQSNMGNYMTRSLGIDVIVRYGAVNHAGRLVCNADNVANLDLVLDEPNATIPNGTTFAILECYRTVLL